MRWLVFGLLLVGVFGFASVLEPRAEHFAQSGQSGNVLKVLFGDSRRLFANHFFVKADIYFHSGYYPSIFDRRSVEKHTGHVSSQDVGEREHEKEADFLGTPRDWIERFGRHFMVTDHTHLEHGAAREILPWLRLSADLDPQRIETYTVAAYWLRTQVNKVQEAEDFLREGLRNNPGNYELLFDLGRLEYENKHDLVRARNLWEQALRQWIATQTNKKDPDRFAFDEITVSLARLEEKSGDLEQAVKYLQAAQKVSPNPAALGAQIAELQKKLAATKHP